MPFTHVLQTEVGGLNKLHLSHLYEFVSAYCISKEEVELLASMLEDAMDEAQLTRKVQVVDRDGRFCFHVTPARYIILMIPWKTFIVAED